MFLATGRAGQGHRRVDSEKKRINFKFITILTFLIMLPVASKYKMSFLQRSLYAKI